MTSPTFPRGTILAAVLGSQAQGFAGPDSDTDYGSVFVGDWSLGGFEDPTQSVQYHDPDIWGHELGKFCKLALACNPTILELLFVGSYEVKTFAGSILVDNAKSFLSVKRISDAYRGYATSQVSRALKDDTLKPRRHALRLLWQGREALRTGTLPVHVPQDIRELILTCTTDDTRFQGTVDRFRWEIEEQTLHSPLPDYPDMNHIRDVVRAVRRTA